MLRTPERDVHVHLWEDDDEQRRHLLFRDWLRENAEDRDHYAAVKRELATREWGDMNDYADAKSPVIVAITARAEAWAAATGRHYLLARERRPTIDRARVGRAERGPSGPRRRRRSGGAVSDAPPS